MAPEGSVALVWFRRDLRLHDHAALHAALKTHAAVHCGFVFDTDILDALPSRADRRVEFIWESVRELQAALAAAGAGLRVLHGSAREEIPRLARHLGAAAVYANRDYEAAAKARDAHVQRELAASGIAFHSRKDQVIFENDEVLTRSGGPFSVFTPYKTAWLGRFAPFFAKPYPVKKYAARLAAAACRPLPSLESLGFARTNLSALAIPAGASGARRLLRNFLRRIGEYGTRRDFPALKGPSYLSVHLRFGTISIRALAARAAAHRSAGAAVWLSELVWRDFYFMILAHHPRVERHAFRPQYDGIRWDAREDLFAAWREARTGYPIVDAAMRQINQTGYMHNRLRMIAASFLTKDLGIDWRRGKPISRSTSSTSTSRPTTAAGNGQPPPVATRSPGSGSSTRSRSPGASTPAAASSAATCRNWRSYQTRSSTRPGR